MTKSPAHQGGFASTGLKLYIWKRDVSIPISADTHQPQVYLRDILCVTALTDLNYCSFSLVVVRNDHFYSADYFTITKFCTILTLKYKPELLSYFKLQNGYSGGICWDNSRKLHFAKDDSVIEQNLQLLRFILHTKCRTINYFFQYIQCHQNWISFLHEKFRKFKRSNCSTQDLLYPAVIPNLTVASLHFLFFSFSFVCGHQSTGTNIQEAGPRGISFKRLSYPLINYLCLGEDTNFGTVVQLPLAGCSTVLPPVHHYCRGPLGPANFCSFFSTYWTGGLLKLWNDMQTIPVHCQRLLFTVCSVIYRLQAIE